MASKRAGSTKEPWRRGIGEGLRWIPFMCGASIGVNLPHEMLKFSCTTNIGKLFIEYEKVEDTLSSYSCLKQSKI